jgi:hypothetical protein
MSALTVPFLMPRVEEVVPDFAMLKDRLTGSSVVEERYTATQVPSSGDTYTVGGSGTRLMIIRVANQNDYIDTSTMVLNFRAQGGAAGPPFVPTTDLALDDHVFSMVDTINVKVGGQTVEVLNNVGHLVNALVQGSMPYNYYKQNGSFEGLYIYDKWNDTLNSGYPGAAIPAANLANTTYPANDPDVTGSNLVDSKWVVGNRWLSNGRYYSVPLTLLGLCRIPTLFAARNFQDVTIEILFRSQLQGCCWTAAPSAAAPAANQVINISDVTLTYDCCRMSADYYALMDNELKMPNGSGVAYAIDTYQVQPASIQAGTAPLASNNINNVATQATTYVAGQNVSNLTRIVVAKGTRFLKGVYGVTKPTASESTFAWRNNSTNGNFSFSSYQVVINSKRYPQLQIQSSAAAFQELQKAYNQLGSVAGGALISWWNYVGHPQRRLGAANGTVATAGTFAPVPITTPQDFVLAGKDGTTLGAFAGDEAMFQNGVNLEQFLTNQPDAGGINTSTSGYQIAIEIANNAYANVPQNSLAGNSGALDSAPLTHYVILHFTRVLTLKAGAVEVLD